MIYTVTVNPSLDYKIIGKTNRTVDEYITIGGKGINVSLVLQNLGIQSIALGFVGGFPGEEIKQRLIETGIHSDFVTVKKGNSRINIKMMTTEETEINGQGQAWGVLEAMHLTTEETEINGQGPHITEEEIEQFFQTLTQINKGDILVLSGSVPNTLPNDFYAQIMQRLQNQSVQVVVDATGDLLKNTLAYHPFLVKPNQEELAQLYNVKMNTIEEITTYAKKLQEEGALNVLVSMGDSGAILVDEEGNCHSLKAPQGTLINSTGAGDSMVAGFLANYLHTKDYAKALEYAICCGSATAFSKQLATAQEVEELMKQIHA